MSEFFFSHFHLLKNQKFAEKLWGYKDLSAPIIVPKKPRKVKLKACRNLLFHNNIFTFKRVERKTLRIGRSPFDTLGATKRKRDVQKLAAASKYLTIWSRFADVQPSPEQIGSAMVYFPLIGLVIGLVLALSNYALAPYLATEVLTITLITILIIITGGLHLEGLRQTFDIATTTTAAQMQNNATGLLAVIMVILFKAAALDSIDQRITVSLFLSPVLARWTLLIFVFGYRERCDQTAQAVAQELKFWHLLIATAVTLGLTSYWLGRKGLWIALMLSLFSLSTRNVLHRLQGPLSGQSFGAMIELAETVCLILLASI